MFYTWKFPCLVWNFSNLGKVIRVFSYYKQYDLFDWKVVQSHSIKIKHNTHKINEIVTHTKYMC